MIRHIAESGPLYIKSMLNIKKSENDSSSNEDSDLSDNECEDVSKTTLPSLRRIMTIDLDNSSKMLCPICLKVLIRLNQIHQILIKMEKKNVKCLIYSKGLMAIQTHRKLSLAKATTLRNLY